MEQPESYEGFRLCRTLFLLSRPHRSSSEKSSQRKINFAAPCFAACADDGEGAEFGVHYEAQRERRAQPLRIVLRGQPTRSSYLIEPCARINIPADQGRQLAEFVQVPGGGQKILIDAQLIAVVGAEAERAAEQE